MTISTYPKVAPVRPQTLQTDDPRQGWRSKQVMDAQPGRCRQHVRALTSNRRRTALTESGRGAPEP